MISATFVLAMAGLLPGAESNDRQASRTGPVPEELPLGRLGFSVGKYLTIEGTRAEKGKVGGNTLLVDTVNGKRLDQPVAIRIENVDLLPRGARCILRGYESARMIGLPWEVAQQEHLPPPQASWQLLRYFIATSLVEPAHLQLRGPADAQPKEAR